MLLTMMALFFSDVAIGVNASDNLFKNCGRIGQTEELAIFESGRIKTIESLNNQSNLVRCGVECHIQSGCNSFIYNERDNSCFLTSNNTFFQSNSTNSLMAYVSMEFLRTGFSRVIFDQAILTESLLHFRKNDEFDSTVLTGTNTTFLDSCYTFHVSQETVVTSNEVAINLSERYVTNNIGVTVNSSLCTRNFALENNGLCYRLFNFPNVQMDFENASLACNSISERITDIPNEEVKELMMKLMVEQDVDVAWIDADGGGQCQVLSKEVDGSYKVVNADCTTKYQSVFCVEGTQRECSPELTYYRKDEFKCCRAFDLALTHADGVKFCKNYFGVIAIVEFSDQTESLKAFGNAIRRMSHNQTFWIGLVSNVEGQWTTPSGSLTLDASALQWDDPVAATRIGSVKCAYVKQDSDKVFVSDCDVQRSVLCQMNTGIGYTFETQLREEGRVQVSFGEYAADFRSQTIEKTLERCGTTFNSIFLKLERVGNRRVGRINVCFNIFGKQIT